MAYLEKDEMKQTRVAVGLPCHLILQGDVWSRNNVCLFDCWVNFRVQGIVEYVIIEDNIKIDPNQKYVVGTMWNLGALTFY